ncbi:MAG: glutathione S-transferase family protein [Gammaproteobacteria bacterium]|nr:glutathione S-transferase family protein [Gammaproteobacteria bacterium]MDH5303041.1 glutathione S-transferase family protein [Gammaproteobacteria bacterium]MDH5321203.1 glutathione S-transferase family protein [Gammaproteobacteria bacterium]
MKLYWAPQTRSARAVWMLEEAGVDYDVEVVDIRNPARQDSAEFRAASPMRKVPALVDGNVQMAESAAICLYVADRYCSGKLAPALDDPQRGEFLYWLMYTPAVIEPTMSEKINKIQPNRGRNGWGDFNSMIATLADGLGQGPWILGEQFTAADVMLGSSVHFLQLFNMLGDAPVLLEYVERCRQRPAFKAMQARES